MWRPETAIRYTFQPNQPILRSPLTAADPYWQPLSPRPDGTRFSPNFPAYISGHATFGAAHAAIMRNYFKTDNISFELTTEDPHGIRDHNGIRKTRRFTSFSGAALENARSRVYLGVHFQWDGDNGYLSGTQLADYLFKNWLTKVAAPAPVPTPA
ncbi:phosphoesterase PA-phosphatase related [Hymenobacter roseosalivarius DSM 11622]|uniref:Phosphoesterase PA-phosphatase related n=1 Tax=Hymenobacter roseosalivarius DSM 11622 TaxID=645990 RepID=A0A1W1W4H3_9BACT|nr:vanadium-dependent haloperoxidase [Hymenobacter roseosalivarius]SMC00528.1 phosphoesterase PA-phosphatase related [Hymenobacter roseosalivarius DSM 11622]